MKTITEHPIFTSGHALADSAIHDFSHWQRVERLGLMIAEKNGADQKVISLFAYLHDARRENEDDDPDHGLRAAQLLDDLISAGLIELTEQQHSQLATALQFHNRHDAQSNDITVMTCWDADRLDLWRVDMEPNPELMFTQEGKSPKMIEFAKKLSLNN